MDGHDDEVGRERLEETRGPAGHPLYTSVVNELLSRLKKPALEVLRPDVTVIHAAGAQYIVLAAHGEHLRQLLLTALSRPFQGAVEIAVIGGDPGVRDVIDEARSAFRTRTRSYHLTESDAPWRPDRERRVTPMWLALTKVAAQSSALPTIDWQTLATRSEPFMRAFERRAEEHNQFLQRIRSQKPYATFGFLILIGCIFALELIWGPPSSVPVLARMGALAREKLTDGEWWRVASSGLLHGSVMHALMNMYVLFALGHLLERVLGTPRFVLLYVISGVVAALGSAFFMTSVSVGASGAIWGLLGAEGALAFSRNSLLPETIREQARRGVMINLALNVAISFTPHVDWAAHFAGGVAGFVLAWTGIVLPRTLDTITPKSETTRNLPILIVSSLFAAVYVAAGLYGIVAGRVWELKQPLKFNDQELPGRALHVSVPHFVGKASRLKRAGEEGYRFGDEFGPLVLTVVPVSDTTPNGAKPSEQDLSDLREELKKVGHGLKLVTEPETKLVSGSPMTTASYEHSSGITMRIVIVSAGNTLWRVSAESWPNFSDQYASVADRVAVSLVR